VLNNPVSTASSASGVDKDLNKNVAEERRGRRNGLAPMKSDMRWSQIRCFCVGLIAYVHGVSVVMSRTAPTTAPTTEAAATTSCGLARHSDVESRTVVASVVVDAIVDGLRRTGRRTASSGSAMYRARLTVVDVVKGRLGGPDGDRPGPPTTITVGTFARRRWRQQQRPGTTSSATTPPICASFENPPVKGSRYIFFLQQQARASSSTRPLIYSISSSPEPFSVNKLDIVRRYARRRYGTTAV